MNSSRAEVVGTRGSRLALTQAEWCAEKLGDAGISVEVRIVRTTSDHRPNDSFSVIDQRDVFTRQLDEALMSGEIDLAIHSLKDVPTDVPEGMVLAAITAREDPSDVLVSEAGWSVDELPWEATVATSSLRRRAQLLHYRPDLNVVEIRGNVETRIQKVREGEADALILARAGLERLGLDAPQTVIPAEIMLPAVGQGALAAAMMRDHPLRETVREALNHEPAERTVLAERAMLRTLDGGCRVPVGALSGLEGGAVWLRGVVASPDGAMIYNGETRGVEPGEVGELLARKLIDQGAGVVLDEIREARIT